MSNNRGFQEFHGIMHTWLREHQELRHFEVTEIIRTWITCPCEQRMTFCIQDDGVRCYNTQWYLAETLPASDPQFFEKLHKLLVEACVVARARMI